MEENLKTTSTLERHTTHFQRRQKVFKMYDSKIFEKNMVLFPTLAAKNSTWRKRYKWSEISSPQDFQKEPRGFCSVLSYGEKTQALSMLGIKRLEKNTAFITNLGYHKNRSWANFENKTAG